MDRELERNIKYNTERVEKEYWIDTKGRVRKFKGDLSEEITSMHYEIVEPIFPDLDNPQQHATKLGWILVGSSVYGGSIIHGDPTKKQIETLIDLNLYLRFRKLVNGFYVKYKDHIV